MRNYERTKLQVCQSQMTSDINGKCYHYTRKWIASLESKNKLKTELETTISRWPGNETYTETNCQTAQLYFWIYLCNLYYQP